MTTKRKLIGRLVPCRCFRGEEEVISVLDYSHCSLQQVPKEIFSFERTLEELYLDANQIEELPKVPLNHRLNRFLLKVLSVLTLIPKTKVLYTHINFLTSWSWTKASQSTQYVLRLLIGSFLGSNDAHLTQ